MHEAQAGLLEDLYLIWCEGGHLGCDCVDEVWLLTEVNARWWEVEDKIEAWVETSQRGSINLAVGNNIAILHPSLVSLGIRGV